MKTEEEKFEHFCNELSEFETNIKEALKDYQSEEYRRGMADGIKQGKVYAAIHLTDLPHDYKMKLIDVGLKELTPGK